MTKLQELAAHNREYWWWVADTSDLSPDAIVEWILNYGEYSEKKALITLLWEKEFEDIFVSLSTKKRSNLRKEAWVYWKLYIDKHFHHA